MRFGSNGNVTLPIGVHLDGDFIRMAQLQCGSQSTQLLASGSGAIPPGAGSPSERLDSVAETIRDLMKSSPFKGRKAVFALPAGATIVQHARVPKLRSDQVDKTLRLELEKTTAGETSDMVIRHTIVKEIVGPTKTQVEVILIAARRTAAEEYIKLAEKAGLECVALDTEACAVAECFGHLMRRDEDAGRALLFINIGRFSTQVVCTQGHNLAFARNLPFGGEVFDKALCERLAVDMDEARALRDGLALGKGDAHLAAEVHRALDAKVEEAGAELSQCISYYQSLFRDKQIALTVFVGDLAHDRVICQSLAKRLNIPAKVGNPMLGIAIPQRGGRDGDLNGQEPHPEWTVAFGLSLGEMWR